MADAVDTQHRIVESLEVKGAPSIIAAFEKLAQATDAAAKALGHEQKELHDSGKAAKGAGEQIGQLGEKSAKKGGKKHFWDGAANAIKEFGKGAIGAVAVGSLLTKVVEGAAAKVRELVAEAWNVNLAFDDALDKITGMVIGMTAWKAGTSESDKFATSLQIGNVLMEEFHETAMKIAVPVEKIRSAYGSITPVLASIGKSQLDILRLTKKASAAAKVYEEDAATAGNVAATAISRGVVRGEGSFARALKAQAGDLKKMSVAERMKKVEGVLSKMGEPVDKLAQGTEEALLRLSILSEGVLQKITYPMFVKIGEVVASIVGYLEENKSKIDDLVVGAKEFLEAVMHVGTVVWDVASGLWKVIDSVGGISKGIDVAFDKFKLLIKIIDLAASGFDLIVASVEALAGKEHGMEKVRVIVESIKIKFREIYSLILKILEGIADMAVPEFLQDKLGVTKLKGWIQSKRTVNDIDTDIAGQRLRLMEKKAGMDATTETTRRMAEREAGIGLSKNARDKLLENAKGLKIEQNIGPVNIQQDFRDQDPDRVLIEFTTGLERIGEAKLQSGIAGAALAHEG